MPAFFLSQSDRDVLAELLGWWRERAASEGPERGDITYEEGTTPDVYIAQVLESPGAFDDSTDTPGYGSVQIYQIQHEEGTDPLLEIAESVEEPFYNFGAADPIVGAWVVISRDKYGSWVYASPAGGGGSMIIREEDGAPSGTPTSLKFPNSSLLDNTDGTYSVRLADTTHAGMVSTVGQSFSGAKSVVGVSGSTTSTVTLTTTGSLKALVNGTSLPDLGDGSSDGHYNRFSLVLPDKLYLARSNDLSAGMMFDYLGPGWRICNNYNAPTFNGVQLVPNVGGFSSLILMGSSTSAARYAVQPGGGATTIFYGQTGTIGGVDFTGGILTGNPASFSVAAGDVSGLAAFIASMGYLDQSTADTLYSPLGHTHSFASLTGIPTTLGGYGITDAVPSSRTITTQYSLTGGGDLSANRIINLVGDTAAPGNLKYYGTDGSGTRGWYSLPAGGSGTVTSVSVTTANGVSGSVATATTTPAITLTLGAITPSSVAATGTVTGSNLSGTNTGDQTITLTGDVTGTGTGSFATTIATNAVTDAKFRQSAGLSVVGRSGNTTGNTADIVAANDAEVLRRSGTAVGFGTVATAGIANNAVTFPKLVAATATQRLIGRNTAAAGNFEEVTLSQLLDWVGSAANGDLLYRSGGVWTRLVANATGHSLRLSGGLPTWSYVPGEILTSGSVSADESTTSSAASALLTADDVSIDTVVTSDLWVLGFCDSYNASVASAIHTFIVLVNGVNVGNAAGPPITAQNTVWPFFVAARATGIAPGTKTVTLRYATNAGTAHFLNRKILVLRG
jgi:hypothetical protein